MGKVIDISEKLKHEDVFVRLDELHIYKVDDRKNTIMQVNAVMREKGEDLESVECVLKLCLGADAYQYIESLNLPLEQYKNIFIAVMAAVSGKSYEETEKQFRDTVK